MNIAKYGSVWSPQDGNFKITGIMNYGGVNKKAFTDQTRMSRSLDISQGLFVEILSTKTKSRS